jgi:hypothetical protein
VPYVYIVCLDRVSKRPTITVALRFLLARRHAEKKIRFDYSTRFQIRRRSFAKTFVQRITVGRAKLTKSRDSHITTNFTYNLNFPLHFGPQ